MRIYTLLLLTSSMFLNACQGKESDGASLVNVTNGVEIGKDEYPAVVRLYLESSSCTASYVAEDTMLTAAHCVHNQPFPKSFKIFMHPLFVTSDEAERMDLALIKFPQKMTSQIIEISSRAPRVGDSITIVGFGLSDSEDKQSAGVKRKGHNTLENASDGLLSFSGVLRGSNDGVNSASATGDSGGPMLFEGKQVGVTSSGKALDGKKASTYVDLNSPESKIFFSKALEAGFKIPLPANFLSQKIPQAI